MSKAGHPQSIGRQAFAAPYTRLAYGRGGLPHVRSPAPRRASARRHAW